MVILMATAAGAAVCWLVAAISAVQMLAHVRPEISKWTMAFRGMAFWSADSRYFTDGVGPAHRRFILGAVSFVICGGFAIASTSFTQP
jgi:hypothetical protein